MKKICHGQTLAYYDGAQVFEGQDSTGCCYIGVLIDSFDCADYYVVAGVSPGCMNIFRAGALDLRTLLIEGAKDAWYLTQTCDDFADQLALQEQSGSIMDTDFLPDDEFVLPEPTEVP